MGELEKKIVERRQKEYPTMLEDIRPIPPQSTIIEDLTIAVERLTTVMQQIVQEAANTKG